MPTPRRDPPTAAMNAYTYYARAAAQLGPLARYLIVREGWLPPVARAWLVRAKAPALAALRQGFAHRCRMPQVPRFDTPMSWLRDMRMLSWLLLAELVVLAGRGDLRATMDCAVDACQLGRDLSCGGLMVGDKADHHIAYDARCYAYPLVEHLTAADAAAIAVRLEEVIAGAVSFADVLRDEANSGHSWYSEYDRQPEKLRWCVEDAVGRQPLDDAAFVRQYRPMVDDARRGYRPMMDALIAWADGPYTRLPPIPEPPNPLLAGPFRYAVRAHVESRAHQAQSRLLLTVIAIHAHQAAHGTPPATIHDLCSHILRAIPLDPFADGKPLGYRRTDAGYILYSIGPDGKDDGGAAIDDPAKGERRHDVLVESVGDIVAGVNEFVPVW